MKEAIFGTFGEILLMLRKERNLSQFHLAKELGVGKSVISLWERNERQPTLPNLKTIAQYFGVSIDFLAGLTDS